MKKHNTKVDFLDPESDGQIYTARVRKSNFSNTTLGPGHPGRLGDGVMRLEA